MMSECQQHGLPAPRYAFEAGGCTVEFFRHSEASLRQGLRDELCRVVLAAQATRPITNSAMQLLLGVSKSTVTRYLNELERAGYVQKSAPPASARRTCSRVDKGFTLHACRALPRRGDTLSSLPPTLSRARAAREKGSARVHVAAPSFPSTKYLCMVATGTPVAR